MHPNYKSIVEIGYKFDSLILCDTDYPTDSIFDNKVHRDCRSINANDYFITNCLFHQFNYFGISSEKICTQATPHNRAVFIYK